MEIKDMQRLTPSFFVIGERKCATSALYRYLIGHPQVLPCAVKEPQFFSRAWLYRTLFKERYKRLFPPVGATQSRIRWFDLDRKGDLTEEMLTIECDPGKPVITGEASANTFARVPPARLRRACPQAKLILCLRHPVDRAFAHYRMLQRFAAEGRRLPIRMTGFEEDFKRDIHRDGGGIFAGVSLYSTRLEAWLTEFGAERMYIVRSEDLRNPDGAKTVMQELCAFLDIDPFDFTSLMAVPVNVSDPVDLDLQLRASLFGYFAEDIHALEQLTGRGFQWEP